MNGAGELEAGELEPTTGVDFTLERSEEEGGLFVLKNKRTPRPPTAAEMRVVETLSGQPIRSVQSDLALAQQMVVFLFLRRRGVPCSWPDAAEVILETEEAGVDPTAGEPSATLPHSAATGA